MQRLELENELSQEIQVQNATQTYIVDGAVESVNGKTGAVVLDAEDVGALPDDTEIPTKTSELTNDSGFLTEHQSLAAYRTSAQQDVIDSGKQAIISDLETIRSGAASGATAYQKPSTGIPDSDLKEAHYTESEADQLLAQKVNQAQGAGNANKWLGTDASGAVAPRDLPIAGESTFGVAKTNSSFGIQTNAEGYLRTSQASSAQIDAKMDTVKPLTSASVDKVVKAGLVSNSQITTAADKKSICGTIGAVYDGQYELIEEITLTEDVSVFERTTEPNGTAYDFDSILLTIERPVTYSTFSYIIVRINETYIGEITPVVRFCNARIERRNGRLLFYGQTAANRTTSSNYIGNYYDSAVSTSFVSNTINKIKLILATDKVLETGTVIKIFAVRA